MIVALDTMVLIWMFQEVEPNTPGLTAEIINLQKRSKVLLSNLLDDGHELCIPTVVIAEYLCGIEPAKHGDVLIEFERWFKHRPVFDLRACVKAAELWKEHKLLPQDERLGRRLLKLDVMVVASASVAGAVVFYSHEAKCRTLAAKAGMDPKDLPTHSHNLIVQAEIMEGKKI